MGGCVRVEKRGRIGWIVFDHPERRNAISLGMWRQIPDAARELEEDEEIRIAIVRGAGEVAFVSGADISEFASHRTGEATRDYDADSARAVGALANFRKPLIAMIHGVCVGGGVAISLAADLRYAADDAVFAIPAARLGLAYPALGIESLAAVVGPSAAKEILFTARDFGAHEAREMGLVNAVLPKAELEKGVRETAERIADNAPLTVSSVKLIARELAKPPAARDAQAVAASIRACVDSEDYREGMRAFLEKRPPKFRGR